MPLSEFMSLIRQGTVQGSKSTAITPLTWAMGILTTGMMGAAKAGLSNWVIGVLSVCLVLIVFGFLFAYAYFAWNNPDALRSVVSGRS